MCLLVVISRPSGRWPLVVAANRDELYDRPADPLGVLAEGPPRTLGGRDRLAGGTWLAVNEHGVVAALTNQPALTTPPQRRSRGAIPLALTGHDDAASALATFESATAPREYNPCWVLVGDRSSLFYLDLTGDGPVRGSALAPGVHVLENRPLGEPSPKAEHVRERLDAVERLGAGELDHLLRGILTDHAISEPAAGDDECARLIACASACCVHGPGYGTRSSTLVRAPAEPSERPQVWASDGPSCENPLVRAVWP